MPEPVLGPRIEGFLWRLFEHFAGGGGGSGGSSPRGKTAGTTKVSTKVLSNWGWAKLVKELLGEQRIANEQQVHPDVMFNRFAHRQSGKLSFEAFLFAVAECDRILAHKHPAASTSSGTSQTSPKAHANQELPRRNAENQENAIPPLGHLLARVSGAITSAPMSPRRVR
jgi:hypothetical protein